MSKITYIATGDANHYTMMRDSKWLATMQFNGELLVPAQESLLGGMIAGIPGQADPGSIKERAAQLVVDMSEMADLHAGNGDTPAAEEFSQGAELVRTMAAQLEAARIDQEIAQFARDTTVIPGLAEALDPILEPIADQITEEPQTAEKWYEDMRLMLDAAKASGLWPVKPEPELTDEAQAERDDFEVYKDESGGCRCHLNPPCGYCTHPGNPANQEDPSCWKVAP